MQSNLRLISTVTFADAGAVELLLSASQMYDFPKYSRVKIGIVIVLSVSKLSLISETETDLDSS